MRSIKAKTNWSALKRQVKTLVSFKKEAADALNKLNLARANEIIEAQRKKEKDDKHLHDLQSLLKNMNTNMAETS